MADLIFAVVAALARKFSRYSAWLIAQAEGWRIPPLKARTNLRFKATLTANLRIGTDAAVGLAIDPRVPGAKQTQREGKPTLLHTKSRAVPQGKAKSRID